MTALRLTVLLPIGAVAALAWTAGAAAQPERASQIGKGEWKERAPLPEERTEVSVTTDGRYIYLAGGFGPPEMDNGNGATAPRTLWRYDPEEDQWNDLTDVPMGLHHAPLQYYDGRLYILGGFRETTFEPIGTVHIYDLRNDEWSEGATMPTPRGASGWTMLHGRIHVIGGNAEGPDAIEDYPDAQITDDNSVNAHEAYDPVSDRWERLAPMPTPRNHLGAAAVDGRIHAVLGRADGTYTMTTHEIYDPAADSWTTAAAVPTGRSGVAVVEHFGYLYTFGGERLDEPNERTYDDAERYNPRTDAWEELPHMPTARHGLGAAAIGNAIYVISGGPGPAFTFGDANEKLVIERE